MSYETLDAIADAYIPILLLLTVAGLLLSFYRRWPHYRKTVLDFCFLLALLVVTYGLMYLDKAFDIWPAFGADYSTHTAAALSLCYTLSLILPRMAIGILLSMVAYILLMLYQQYHSVLDIISTAAVVSLFAALLRQLLFRNKSFDQRIGGLDK